MSSLGCARSFEAEALRDRRLNVAELASFERHLGGCAACKREVQALEALAHAARANADERTAGDELHARRERTRLLAAFAARRAAPANARARVRPWQLAVAAAAFGLVAGAALWHARPAPALRVAVHAGPAAIWSQRSDALQPRLVLERGTLFVEVEHLAAQAARLRVALPDGELEDIGTVFSVTAERGRTTRVFVREGSVVLRVRGRAARVIAAGEIWVPEAPAAPRANTAPNSPPLSASAAPSAAAHTPQAKPLRSATRPDPARDFRTAVELLERGHHREAAAAFARYSARDPGDAHAEDAAYLRVLALHQAGDRAARNAAAKQYLRDYPAGLRHVEVEKWSRAR